MSIPTTHKLPFVLGTLVLSAVLGCGGRSPMEGMPGGMTGSGAHTFLMSVSPRGSATRVATTTSIVLTFSHAMAAGMEQYVDLHEGDLSAPTVALSCSWSGDRTTLTCAPAEPLKPGTHYTTHIGAGVTDAGAGAVDFDQYRAALGGQWVMGGMMGTTHGGMGMGSLGAGWRGANGSYGMAFPFTTA